MTVNEAAVIVGYAPPARQRRVTIGFRLLLAVPALIVLMAFAVAGLFVAIGAWFYALFTGEVPEGMHELLAGFIRYGTRVAAYCWLLTDRYPPFNLDRADYPVSVAFTRTKLNRVAVFFRLLLALPAWLVSSIVSAGASAAAVVIWVIALVNGQLPRSLFEALASVLRFQARLISYVALVTPAYPNRLFGDPSSDEAPPALPMSSPLPPGAPLPPPGYMVPAAPLAPFVPTDAPPLVTHLVLSKSARWVVVLFLVLGIVGNGTSIAVSATSDRTRLTAIDDLNRDYDALTHASDVWVSTMTACKQVLTCVQGASRDLEGPFATFADEVAAIEFPSGSHTAAAMVIADARQMAALLERAASAPSRDDYLALAPQVADLGAKFDQDYEALANGL